MIRGSRDVWYSTLFSTNSILEVPLKYNNFVILVYFAYFVWGAKRSTACKPII